LVDLWLRRWSVAENFVDHRVVLGEPTVVFFRKRTFSGIAAVIQVQPQKFLEGERAVGLRDLAEIIFNPWWLAAGTAGGLPGVLELSAHVIYTFHQRWGQRVII
jgi:hypothetical protein